MPDEPGTTIPHSASALQGHKPSTPLEAQVIADILKLLGQKRITLGRLLQLIFTTPAAHSTSDHSQTQIQKVTTFLQGKSDVKIDHILELIYESRYSVPLPARGSANRPASEAKRQEKEDLAKWRMEQWALRVVGGMVDREAHWLASVAGGLHLLNAIATWEFFHNFSFSKILQLLERKGPTILHVLMAIAIPEGERPQPVPITAEALSTEAVEEPEEEQDRVPEASDDPQEPEQGGDPVPSTDNPAASLPKPVLSFVPILEKPAPSRVGENRRDPLMLILVGFLILMNARNLQFTAFQKLVGVWLFAHTVPHGIYNVLGRMGLTVSYTTVLSLLKSLTRSTKDVVRAKALTRAFLLIYDNINRMSRAWDPDLGQKDKMQNGTAATFVELEDCNVQEALDPEPLKKAHEEERRKQFNLEVLYKRINWGKLESVMALHCLSILVQDVPSLADHNDMVRLRFKTTMAIHRMRRARKTKLHPLATSNLNEGNTEQNIKILHDLLVSQLGLPPDEVEKLLVIVGGDQSTVEKLRILKKFLADCPHGYHRYGWVIPLIQLWHMGWADLDRILKTHWGGSQAEDPSGFCAMNILLGRKVKNSDRPDYYPAQHLVFDVLKAEVLDCWRVKLGVSNLDQHFIEHPANFEDLWSDARALCRLYMSGSSAENALFPNPSGPQFPGGREWTQTACVPGSEDDDESPFEGDQVLANTCLRMRDSMLHYEFQCAISDGDIGRAMNVMTVWTFTFTGSGKTKYSNELLELACSFEYEYSPALQELIKNNWLCNLSGLEGCWFGMDLLQEKNIKQLKKMAQHRDSDFGGSFFKDIIAVNIRAFLEAKDTMKSAVRLTPSGGTHYRTSKEAAMNELAASMDEKQLHRYREGRTWGYATKNDLEVGYGMLAQGPKIRDFVARTLRDAGAIHGEGEGDDSMEGSGEEVPLPNMLVNNILISGDELDLFELEGDKIHHEMEDLMGE